jgi:hypothetical protein
VTAGTWLGQLRLRCSTRQRWNECRNLACKTFSTARSRQFVILVSPIAINTYQEILCEIPRWTRTERAWNIITFRGSTIEIFGVRSPDSGQLTVEIDEEEVVSINAYSDRFVTNSSIFKTTDLESETMHSLRLINGNGLMYFDYAVVDNQ